MKYVREMLRTIELSSYVILASEKVRMTDKQSIHTYHLENAYH
jgi:hypothetical protein